MIGLTHTVAVKRYSTSVDAEGTPVGDTTTIQTVKGKCHETPSPGGSEQLVAGTLGAHIGAHCLLPYGTTVIEQDILTVTFSDATSRSFRVTAVRDNHVGLRVDLVRDVA